MRRLVLFAIVVLVGSGLASAQTETASLSGRILDPSGAAIAGATVIATNTQTNVSTSTRSARSGDYAFAALQPAQYQITVRAPGFKENVRKGLILHVLDRVSLSFSLEIGSAQQTVVVNAEAQPLNTEDATVGTVVERQVIESMPLNGRSFQGLITLSPGVASIAASGTNPGQFVVNGQRPDTSYFMVDGVSANVGASPGGGSLGVSGSGSAPTNSSTGGYNNLISLDSIQEFRISTSSFAPEFGRTPGGQVSIVSRGGTNAFHGDAFDYFRNTVLDANDWFLNTAGKPRGVVQQNDFGGVFGGPLLKNKLFFFLSYEGLRLSAPTPSVKLVPTQAARNLAAAATANGVTGYMAQFLNAFALPDGNPSTPCTSFATCLANLTSSFPSKSSLDTGSARVDYTLNSRISVFGRYSHAPSDLSFTNSVLTTAFTEGTDAFTAGLTATLRNSMVNDARFNVTNTTVFLGVVPFNYHGGLGTVFPPGHAQPPADFIAGASSTQIPADMAVQIRFATDGFIDAPVNGASTNYQYNATDTFSWLRGNHQLKFGGDVRVLLPTAVQSAFNWNNSFAIRATINGNPLNVCPAASLPPGSGNTVPGFICGQASLSNLQHNYGETYRIVQYSFFGQDTWRVTPRLTLTYGLRWEINPPFQWTNGHPGFSLNAASFNLADLSKLTINPFGAAAYQTSWDKISPRIGVAYRLSANPKWGRVLRAGYGIFYDTGDQTGIRASTPWNARFNNVGGGATSTFVQFPIAPADSAYVTPPLANLTLPVSQGGFDVLIDPNFTLPYVHEANVTLEQKLGAAQTVTVAYVGAFARNLLGEQAFPASRGNPAVFSLNGKTDALDIFGNYSFSDYNALQTRFQRQFSNGLAALASYTWSHSIDDASSSFLPPLTLPTAPQLSAGLPVALLKGPSDFDIRHNFALSAVYNVPTPFKNYAFARAVLGNWSVDPIYHLQTAVPIDILTGISGVLGGTSFSQRPNRIPGVPVYVSGTTCDQQYLGTQGFSGCPGGSALNLAPVSASMAAAAGCLAPTSGKTANAKGAFCTPATVNGQLVSGTLGRNALRSFPLQEFDFSLQRDFILHERLRLRFQADVFNVLNHPQFGPVTAGSANLNAANFGLATEMANAFAGAGLSGGGGLNPVFAEGAPRNIQLALKLLF
ncbi:MAG TPA: TonB-dependent receptor [Candidatus Acidoferrales bacterium]|nr:TonB-dependent receptor [Candidatus Acidoferrales bacterium]